MKEFLKNCCLFNHLSSSQTDTVTPKCFGKEDCTNTTKKASHSNFCEKLGSLMD
jgi:hypothetical protein